MTVVVETLERPDILTFNRTLVEETFPGMSCPGIRYLPIPDPFPVLRDEAAAGNSRSRSRGDDEFDAGVTTAGRPKTGSAH